MGKLLVTIQSAIDEFAVLAGSLEISQSAVLTVAAALGDTAVICGSPLAPRQGCFAIARVSSIHASTKTPLACEFRIDELRFLRKIVPLDRELDMAPNEPGIIVAPLADELAEKIMRAGGPSLSPIGLAEEQAPFTVDAEPQTSDSVLKAVVAAYEDTCAFTGAPLLTASGGRTSEPVTSIRPLAAGGRAAPGNFIAAIPEARAAFEGGHLTLGERFEFIAALDKLDPELLEMLNANGRLRLPVNAAVWPSPDAIAYHQSFVFNRPL